MSSVIRSFEDQKRDDAAHPRAVSCATVCHGGPTFRAVRARSIVYRSETQAERHIYMS